MASIEVIEDSPSESVDADVVHFPDLVALPGGTFVMGSDTGRSDERPAHDVTILPFELARHLVTNREYGLFLRATGCAPPAGWHDSRFSNGRYPVCGVSWVDAARYCEWLNTLAGADPKAPRYHLPTEAQRQYAAAGGTGRYEFPWGNESPPLVGHYARGQDGPLVGRPMMVGTVPWWPAAPPSDVGPAPGLFGLFHLADNVHEWCADYYDRTYDSRSPRENPLGPSQGDRRVATAGSWRHDFKFARNAARSSLAPTKRFLDFGFRVARSEGFAYVFSEDDSARP